MIQPPARSAQMWRLPLVFLAMAISLLPTTRLSAAYIRVVQLTHIDRAHNGSIDLDVYMGSNLHDGATIHCNVALDGPIVVGDFDQLSRLVKTNQYPRLCLNSPGGSYDEALRIIQLLINESVGTALQANAVCASACALIFMAGSAPWKGRLNRFMHPSSTLAFHAPYLAGQGGERYGGPDLATAFQAGIRAISKLMNVAETTVPNFFPNELLREMLDKGPSETYAIDTVGKVIRYRIHLFDARGPVPLTEATFCNACANIFFGARENSVGGLCALSGRQPFPQGLRLEFDAAPRGGSCLIDLEMSAGTINAWYLHQHATTDRFGGKSAALALAYWYLYSADTPLVSLPRAAAMASPPVRTPSPRPAPLPTLTLEQRIATFIANDYLGDGKTNHVQSPSIFAVEVQYYAKGSLSRSALLADRASYHARWPYRRYDGVPDTVRIAPKGHAKYDVTFDYTFLVANGPKQISGRGTTSLTLHVSLGRIEITREDGKVVERR